VRLVRQLVRAVQQASLLLGRQLLNRLCFFWGRLRVLFRMLLFFWGNLHVFVFCGSLRVFFGLFGLTNTVTQACINFKNTLGCWSSGEGASRMTCMVFWIDVCVCLFCRCFRCCSFFLIPLPLYAVTMHVNARCFERNREFYIVSEKNVQGEGGKECDGCCISMKCGLRDALGSAKPIPI